MWKRMLWRAAYLLCMLGAFLPQPAQAEEPVDTHMQLEGVDLLFDLVEAIVDLNPGYGEKLETIAAMDKAAAEIAFDSLALRNRSHPVIAKKIDALLATETYQVYFRRFKNVNPEIFERAFVNLPYRSVPTPGGVSSCFLELSRNVESVRDWMREVVREIDIARCGTLAERWLPRGNYEPVTIYFLYDSNAGSFTAEGKPFFNLQSMIGEISPGGDLSSKLASIGITAMEEVIAHEMHHIYARPALYPLGLSFNSWQDRWLHKIVREMVSEGVAGQCNPCTGFKKELWEDPDVLASLIRELNRVGVELSEKSIEESEVKAWYSATYQGTAQELLKLFLAKRHSPEDADRLLWEYMPVRPDLVHTLGWWMVSRITHNQSSAENAVALIEDPSTLFARYNDTLEDDMVSLRVDDTLAARVNALGSGTQ